MKSNSILLSALLFFATSAPALFAAPTDKNVPPKETGRAALILRAYDADGNLLREGNAFFVSVSGDAIAPYGLLLGASRAEVTDWKGNSYKLFRITGANSTADLVRFSTVGVKKASFLKLAEEAAGEGAQLFIVPSAADKKAQAKAFSVTSVEPFGDLKYYHVTVPNDSADFGRALVNLAGEAVGVVQRNVGKDAAEACAVDARYVSRLTVTATSALSSDLRALRLPKALPAKAKDALTYIYMTPATDSLGKATACDDFIAAWPELPDGYVQRGTLSAAAGRYADCDRDFATAVSLAEKAAGDSVLTADAVRYSWSNIIYDVAANTPDSASLPATWNLQRACDEAKAAYAVAPHTLYLQQQGKCYFTMKRYAEAAAIYEKVVEDKTFATPAAYFATARSLELAGADSSRVLALLDSAVNAVAKPVSARDAQYYLERSQRLIKAGLYRRAVADYNEYEKAVGTANLNERFYYLREQAEVEAHMYQQALDDIRTAVSRAEMPAPYRLEEALLLLRVGEFEDASAKAAALLRDLPENPDCYKIIGIAAGERGRKAAALENLRRARDLGDESAEMFIEKYEKLKATK